MEINQLLTVLCSSFGGAGSETAVTAKIASLFENKKYAFDQMGNLAVELCPKKAGRPVIMLEAHTDEIGFIATEVCSDGRVMLSAVGGVDKRTLYSAEVFFAAKSGPVRGTICSGSSDPDTKDIYYADIGYTKENSPITPGDRCYLSPAPFDFGNGMFCSKSLDNRVSCAVVLKAAEAIGAGHNCGVYALFSVQEEIGLRGAGAGAFGINPDAAVCVDASFGDAPSIPSHQTGTFGGGPMIGVSPILNQKITDDLIAAAKGAGIPYQTEIMAGSTGTNADAVSRTGGGIPTGLVSVPIRNMHTGIELVCTEDVLRSAKLLVSYINIMGGKSGV